MDLINQIALIAHESFYAMLRAYALETNSVRTRRSIGYALSGKLFDLEIPEIPKNNLYCYDLGIPYAPTNISFFLKKDSVTNKESLVVYPETSHSSKFIGLLTNLFNFPMIDVNQYSMMTSGKCKRDGADNMFFSFNMEGPVEFDRLIQIDWVCKSGNYSAFLTDHKPGSKESITTPLVCKSIQ